VERRLVAILAADVVGYSRLMAENEADTFDRLRAHRKELFEPTIAKHHGRVFKHMGDGLLAEFGSVVDAVECAAVLQREMAKRNEGLPTNRHIDMRMGVHEESAHILLVTPFGSGGTIGYALPLPSPLGLDTDENKQQHRRTSAGHAWFDRPKICLSRGGAAGEVDTCKSSESSDQLAEPNARAMTCSETARPSAWPASKSER
jgi:adenylate cyclase